MMDGTIAVLTREMQDVGVDCIDYRLQKMGCNQSVEIQRSMASSRAESRSEKTEGTETVAETDADAIDRFKGSLIKQLQAIADGPPMMPMKLVEGDSRELLVPSIFRCTETLAELKETPLPPNSSLLITYLKSGTHWLWEVMKMLKKGEATTDDKPKEMGHLEFFPPSCLKEINGIDLSVFATHFPMWTLPASSYSSNKLVYVYRNPKDVCVSLHYHFLNMSKANPEDFPAPSFAQSFERFMGPSEANLMGNWFDHVADFWDNHRNNPAILCIRFEDMKQDLLREIRKIDKHLGTNSSDELLAEIANIASFSSLKEKKHTSEQHLEIIFQGSMYRKGEVGDWKNHLTEAQNQAMDAKLAEWQMARSEPVPLLFELSE